MLLLLCTCSIVFLTIHFVLSFTHWYMHRELLKGTYIVQHSVLKVMQAAFIG